MNERKTIYEVNNIIWRKNNRKKMTQWQYDYSKTIKGIECKDRYKSKRRERFADARSDFDYIVEQIGDI